MLRGKMMMGMKMGGSPRHLAMNVPVAVMEEIGAGTADLHYGNNVPMPGGHRFTVTATLKGQKAVFSSRRRRQCR
jgi:hypothetical protein